MLSSDFHYKENYGTSMLQHIPRTWFRLFLAENQTPVFKALNTTSLKCCLSSNDAIARREKFTHAYEGPRSPHSNAHHWNPPGFRKKKRLDTFLTDHVKPWHGTLVRSMQYLLHSHTDIWIYETRVCILCVSSRHTSIMQSTYLTFQLWRH